MDHSSIQQAFLRAAIQCAQEGATAKELADYLELAAKGMRTNAAFCLSGENLVSNLKLETES